MHESSNNHLWRMQLRMEQEDEKIHSSFTLFYIVWIFKNHGQVIFTIIVKCFGDKVFCSPPAYWALALSCRNYLFSPLNPFLHEKQNKIIIFQCPVKVCSCPLLLPVVEPEEISQIGSEKEADDSAFRAGKHMSYSIHQHINLELHIHLRLCLLFAGEPWARDLIFRTSLSIKWRNVMVSLWRRLNETLYFQVKCLAGASCYLPRHKESCGEIQRGKQQEWCHIQNQIWNSLVHGNRVSPIPNGNLGFQYGCQWVPAVWPTHKTHPQPRSKFHQLKTEGTKVWSVRSPLALTFYYFADLDTKFMTLLVKVFLQVFIENTLITLRIKIGIFKISWMVPLSPDFHTLTSWPPQSDSIWWYGLWRGN